MIRMQPSINLYRTGRHLARTIEFDSYAFEM